MSYESPHKYEILCPDGNKRHFPYINKGDAEADAKVCDADSSKCDSTFHDENNELQVIPCPGGTHQVVPVARGILAPIRQPKGIA